MSDTYDRLPSSHDATPHALAQEVKLLRDEAVMQRKEAASLRVHIGELKQQLATADEAIEVAVPVIADRIEELECANASLKGLLGDQLDPRVAAAAVIFKALTGREQPMDCTAEDVIAELQILVDQSGSEIWETPPVPVSLTYILTVEGAVDNPNRDPVVLRDQLAAEFFLGTTANCRFHNFKVTAVAFDGAQYG